MKTAAIGCAALAALTLICATPASAEIPLGTAITYQGQLKDAGSLFNGAANMRFSLWDSDSAGTQIGGALTFDGLGLNPPPVNVASGLFTVQLDFGAGFYDGQRRWLEIVVNGATMSPRQEVTAAPYSLYSAAPWFTGGNHISNINSGGVGIGTPAPGNRLEVLAAFNGDGIRVTGSIVPIRSAGYQLYDGATQRGTLGLAEGATAFSTDALAGDVVLRTNTGKLLLQNGTGGSAMAISDNNVGVGTTSPENTLHVMKASAGSITGNVNAPLIVENNASTFINILAPDANEQGILFGKPAVGSAAGGIIYDSSSTTDGLQFRANGNITMMVLDSTGNVGISTGAITPGAKLDVRGDIKLGPSGEFQAPAAEERLRILRGRVSATGSPIDAVGWTSIRTSLGAYTVTFTANFSGSPTVTASALDSSVLQSAVVAGLTIGSLQIKTYNSSGALVDTDFMFIAIGAR